MATLSPVPSGNDVEAQFQRLLDFEPTTLPVISLYLNTRPDKHGRDRCAGFVDHEFAARARTFAAGSEEAGSFARDAARIRERIVREEGIRHVALAGDAAMVPGDAGAAFEPTRREGCGRSAAGHEGARARDFRRYAPRRPRARRRHRTPIRRHNFSSATLPAGSPSGPKETLEALANGQVDELLISASLERSHESEPVDAILAPETPDAAGSTATDDPRPVLLADLLATKAKQTAARVSFTEDANLPAGVDGVGAFLRWI